MRYREEIKDLFSVNSEYYLAHCISADFGMGKGIVVEFNKRFDLKSKLLKEYGMSYITTWDKDQSGHCIREDRVFNLVTKRNYYDKPTYATLAQALIEMKNQAEFLNIKKIAMPIIGCGLDKLEWNKVRDIILGIFEPTDIEILVCRKD